MPKVRLKISCCSSNGTHTKGDVIDVSPEEAKQLCDNGYAVLVKDEPGMTTTKQEPSKRIASPTTQGDKTPDTEPAA